MVLCEHERAHYKAVIVRVSISGHETSSPVDSSTDVCEVALAKRGEVVDPVIGIGEFVNFLLLKAKSAHDLELVLHGDVLGSGLALLRSELEDVGLGGLLGGCGYSVLLGILLLVVLEVLAKHLHLASQLVGARLDGHSGAVISLGEEGSLALHAGPTGSEFDLGSSKGLTQKYS